MRRLLIFLLPAICLLLPLSRGAALQGTTDSVEIISLAAGEALQGNIPVRALILSPGFRSAELSFAYSNDSTQTWFLIAEVAGPDSSSFTANWDTTTLTDGSYKLRLLVTRADGRQISDTVLGLRVRNYTPIETPTPTLSPTPAPEDTPVPTLTPIPTLTPVPLTATPLPTNPAQITTGDITNNLTRGALATTAFFLLVGLYGSARRYFRR